MNFRIQCGDPRDLALEGLKAADEVTDLLLGLGWDVDEDQPIVTNVTGDFDSVAPISLPVLAGSAGDQ